MQTSSFTYCELISERGSFVDYSLNLKSFHCDTLLCRMLFGRWLLAGGYDVCNTVSCILTLSPALKSELLVSLPVCVISVDNCGQVLVTLQARVVWHVKIEVLHHSFALNS